MRYLLILLLLSGCSTWSTQDIVMESTWQALHVIDWQQTLNVADNPDQYYELNPFIGKHPSRGKVNSSMGLYAVGHAVITHYIPRGWQCWKLPCRTYWQGITLGTKAGIVYWNYSVGLGP